MEAKDTVMSDEQIKELLEESPLAIDYLVAGIIAKAQAEKTASLVAQEIFEEIETILKASENKTPFPNAIPIELSLVIEALKEKWLDKMLREAK